MARYLLIVFLLVFISISSPLYSADNDACHKLTTTYYSHWSAKDKNQCEALIELNNFIEANKGKGLIALFDWDGTLYGEKVKIKEYRKGGFKAGQPAWHIWAAYHMFEYDDLNLLPLFKTYGSKNDQIKNAAIKDDYLEGKLDPKPKGYDKFSQIAIFEAGMTPVQMTEGIRLYLKDYKPCRYAIYPALDIMQRLSDAGFEIWIVTGSNPYYVATVLDAVEKECKQTKNKHYDFNISGVPYSIGKDKIVGNAAKLGPDGKFSQVYEDKFVKGGEKGKLYVIEREGKRVAVKNYIEKSKDRRAVFCAGNSGGDTQMMEYVLMKDDSFGLFVNPRGDLKTLITKFPSKIIEASYKEAN